MKKLYFLGPKGTYSEIAAKNFAYLLKDDFDLIPVSTIAKVIELTSLESSSCAVVPIENSIEGIVRPAIDNIYLSDIKIQAQIEVNINHCLISRGDFKNIKHIISHPQALAQCQRYIAENFDEKIELINAESTAQAVKCLSDRTDDYAAIASENLADSKKNLNIAAKNISDIKDNKTRFVLISKNDLKLSAKSRTSIVFNTKNEPGALLKILSIVKKYNLNLVYIESRPSKKVFGEYNFFADLDKGIEEIKPALEEIQKECNYYKLLGSYPIFKSI